MYFLEIQTREVYVPDDADDDRPWTAHPLHAAGGESETVELRGLNDGREYDVRSRIADMRGRSTSWSVSAKLVMDFAAGAPPAPVGLALDDADCLTWHMPEDVEDLAGFEIRTAADGETNWEVAVPAHHGIWPASPLPLCAVPGGRRTYLVAAVDTSGNVSPTPAVLIATRSPVAPVLPVELNVKDFATLGFPGTKLGASVSGLELVADADPLVRFWRQGVGEAAPFWDATVGALFWGSDDAVFWPQPQGGAAKFWGPDASLFWGAPFSAIVYEASYELAPANEGGRLTLDVAATPAGWLVQFRRRTDAFWGEADTLFWGAGSDLFWTLDVSPWRPWPGKVDNAGAGTYGFRFVAPSGLVAARLTTFEASVTRARTDAEMAALLPLDGYATTADLAAHEAAADPHPGYLTAAEGTAAFAAIDKAVSQATWSVLGTFLGLTTYYAAPGAASLPTVEYRFPVTRLSTVRKLYARVSTAPAAGNNVVVTMRKNGVDQPVTLTIADAATTANDTTNSFTVAAGDLVSVKVVTSALNSAENLTLGFELLPT